MERFIANLNTNDVFVLKSPDSMFPWGEVGATDEVLSADKYVCSFLGHSATEVAEGKEPGDHSPINTFKTNTFKSYLIKISL